MENVFNYLKDMLHEQIVERQRILRHIDQVEADLEVCYADKRSGIYTGVELQELELDMEEKGELLDALHGDLACVNYMIRQLRSKRALVEVEMRNWSSSK